MRRVEEVRFCVQTDADHVTDDFDRPFKANPEYKGKWYAPMIDNPAYIGEWAPRKIPNPDYFEDATPVKSLNKIVRMRCAHV